MKSHITLLIGDRPSTKQYSIDPVTDYPQKGKVQTSYYHESYTLLVTNLADLFEQITIARSTKNGFIIRGLGQDNYQAKVRRTLWLDDNSTQPNFMETGSAWICCDFDQYEIPSGMVRTSAEAIEFLIDTHLPKVFQNVSYIYQWSASAGLEYKGREIKAGTNVHLFFYLDKLVDNVQFKTWFSKQINDGFDMSTFNTVLPIFVGSDVIKDPRIIDTIVDSDKFGIIAKDNDVVKVPVIKQRVQKPVTCTQQINIDSQHKIAQVLNSLGAVHRKGQGYIKLWHRGEGSKGDWFLYTKNLEVVHHHVKKSMRIDRWLKEFWGHDLDVKFETSRTTQPIINRNKI